MIFSKKVFLICFLFFLTTQFFGQNKEDRLKIIKNYDLQKLESLKNKFSEIYKIEKNHALKYAQENGIEVIKQTENNSIAVLQRVLSDGSLVYYETFNAGSAQTINTNQVQEGGSLGLSLDGSIINLGIWDGGLVRTTHQEFGNRVVQKDNASTLSNHATHVTGTLIASGVDPNAKGMATQAQLSAYDFENDFSEMITEAANGMLISNHSYGISPASIDEEIFGAYIGITAQVDQITYNAPYYLPVFAAGNSNNNFPAYNPTKNGYDLISGINLAKNIISVANVEEVNNYIDASSVVIYDTSSWGPTDDGRIKPDISAKGRLTYSSTFFEDDTYDSYTGTSMAAPSVSGSIALLQEHHHNMYGYFLTAASMRAIVMHSAREAGSAPGPDYKYGWGLMDTAEAANSITNKDFTTIIEENTLNDSNTYTFSVEAVDPNEPLIVTIAWTDPAGIVQNISTADDPTPRLVNDLDIKVTAPDGFTEFLPWTLDPSQPDLPATTGDNVVDNIEKIQVNNAVGIYTIEVSHKGNLQGASQDYSIIVSGISETDFTVKSYETNKTYCSDEIAEFEIIVNSLDSFNADVNLSVTGLPAGLNSSFLQNTISGQGETILNIDNLDTVSSGSYPFSVIATSGNQSSNFDFVLEISSSTSLSDVQITGPSSTDLIGLNPTLTWQGINNATTYEVELSDNPNFNSILLSFETQDTFFVVPTELEAASTYYWRVKAINDCSESNFENSTFQTIALECNDVAFASDTPIQIPNDMVNTQQSVINIPANNQNNTLEDINVVLDISHTWLSDLKITLTSPQGTSIILADGLCSDLDDMDVTFDDKGNLPSCSSGNSPALSGIIAPLEKLSTFVGENMTGDWILSVEDLSGTNGGSINNFGLEICTESELSTLDFELSKISLYPNPAHEYVNINLYNYSHSKAKVTLYDIKGKILKYNKIENTDGVYNINLSGLNSGMYLVKVETENQSAVKKLIIKK